MDESREGVLIQVVDPAQVPERKSKPSRGLTAVGVTLASFVLLLGWALLRGPKRPASSRPLSGQPRTATSTT